MNKSELALVAQFLEELNDRFSNDGCNDFDLPNTPGNVKLLCDAIKLEAGDDAAEMIEEIKAEAKGSKHILTQNFVLCQYLAHLAKLESK